MSIETIRWLVCDKCGKRMDECVSEDDDPQELVDLAERGGWTRGLSNGDDYCPSCTEKIREEIQELREKQFAASDRGLGHRDRQEE